MCASRNSGQNWKTALYKSWVILKYTIVKWESYVWIVSGDKTLRHLTHFSHLTHFISHLTHFGHLTHFMAELCTYTSFLKVYLCVYIWLHVNNQMGETLLYRCCLHWGVCICIYMYINMCMCTWALVQSSTIKWVTHIYMHICVYTYIQIYTPEEKWYWYNKAQK